MIVYKNKKVTVVGLARSGLAAARLLKTLGAQVRVTEKNQSLALLQAAEALKKEDISVEVGKHSRSFVDGSDLVVVSPGVSDEAEPCCWAQDLRIEIISEIELAASVCAAPIIAITGTNGKTTTTTLVGEIIKASGRKCFVLGNIGQPFSQYVSYVKPEDFISLEVSSFQLEAIKQFHPKVAVILNLTPDHLDRYRSMEEYLAAKKRIFMNQGEDDWLILNHKDEVLFKIAPEAKSQVLYFNKSAAEGDFNPNELAVLAVAQVLQIERKIVLDVFKNFKGVEHRMEFVREFNGIEFVNDSKATNIDSTIWALTNIKKPAILIAGGRDKGSNFSSIASLVKEKIEHVVLVGEAAERIEAAWHGIVPMTVVQTFSEAVKFAAEKASWGGMVLFSPMCKSFDMFTDYEHRGRTFKQLVNQLS